jgi:hypothetical protein
MLRQAGGEMRSLIKGMALAALGFAVWCVFALPVFTGAGHIREAWDTGPYWSYGFPLLLAVLLIDGAMTAPAPGRAPWQLALYAAFGHALAAATVVSSGTDFNLAPLTVVFVGLPMFAVLFACAALGRLLRRLWT